MPSTIGIDQYGQIYRSLQPHPRKALLDRFYSQHAEKMYVDVPNSTPKHVGYIINGHWIALYERIEK